jgi:hypothetical protein
MPIYEYKCPNGHLLEVFHGMNELHPVAVHYKGSGFYSTDYGRGRKSSKDSGSSDSSGGGGDSSSSSSTSDGGGSSSAGSSSGSSSSSSE